MYNAMGFYHRANIPASTVPSHVPRSYGSALRFRSFRLRFTVQVAAVPPHSPGSLNSVSQFRQSQLCFTVQAISVQAVSTPPHSSSSLSPSNLNSASQPRQSRLRLTFPAISTPSHSTIQIKYSFPSSLIFCRDFWILMRILSGTPAILFSICSATIS